MDKRVFPGPTLAAVSSDGVAAMARGGAGLDRSAGLAGLVEHPAASGPHGHRLYHRDEFWQRVPTDGRPKLQKRACNRRRIISVGVQSDRRGGSILDLLSVRTSKPLCRDHRQHDDPWAVAV